jgi:hypothetical protein
MGRQIKEGLDYYYTNVDFEENDKVSMMLAECQMLGEVVLQRLWRAIYRNKGYYYPFGEDECMLMCRRIGYGLKPIDIKNVVEICLKRNLFDKRLFDTYGILTNRRVQENYLIATRERINVRFDQRFLLIEISPKVENVTVYNPDLSAGKPPINAINPLITPRETVFLEGLPHDKSDKSREKYTKESKGENSIVNNSTEEERREGEFDAPQVTLFSKGYFKISIEERKTAFWGAVASMQDVYVKECIEKFFKKWSEYTPSGKRMKFELERTWDLADRLHSYGQAWNEIESKKTTTNDTKRRPKSDSNLTATGVGSDGYGSL